MSGETEHTEDMKGLDGVGALYLNLLSWQKVGEGSLQKGGMTGWQRQQGKELEGRK